MTILYVHLLYFSLHCKQQQSAPNARQLRSLWRDLSDLPNSRSIGKALQVGI